MTDGVPDTGDDLRIEREADPSVTYDEEGTAIAARVVSEYRVERIEDGEVVVDDREQVELAYEIDSGVATPETVSEVVLDEHDQVAQRLAGLRPNALRAVPHGERVLTYVPGIEVVQHVEDAMDSCVSVARDGGDSDA